MNDPERPQFTSSLRQWARLSPIAHEMRHASTPAEEALWQHLRNRQLDGVKFRRQHAVEGYIVDFIAIEHRLIVEVDGEVHTQPEQQEWDQERQRVLEEKGFRILRFRNQQVFDDIGAVTDAIKTAMTQ